MQCGTVRHTGTGSGHACLHASCAPDRVATPVKRHGLAAVTHHLGVHKLSSGRKLKPGGVDVRRRAKRSRHIVACLNDEASLQLGPCTRSEPCEIANVVTNEHESSGELLLVGSTVAVRFIEEGDCLGEIVAIKTLPLAESPVYTVHFPADGKQFHVDPEVHKIRAVAPLRLGMVPHYILDAFADWKSRDEFQQATSADHASICKYMFACPGNFGLPHGITASRALEQIRIKHNRLKKQHAALSQLVEFQTKDEETV